MQPTAERPFCLADFRPFLEALAESEDESVLVGGLAVAAWAELFLVKEESLRFDLPIFSKDIDLRGHKITCMALTQLMRIDGADIGSIVVATRKNAPHMGRVFAASVTWREYRTTVEVMERLPGLDSGIDDTPNGTPLSPVQHLSLLDPCSLFMCKLHAANTRNHEKAPFRHETHDNDEKHLSILACVIPRFLNKLRKSPASDYDGTADAKRLLLHIEACQSRKHPFRLLLPPDEIGTLCSALRNHLQGA